MGLNIFNFSKIKPNLSFGTSKGFPRNLRNLRAFDFPRIWAIFTTPGEFCTLPKSRKWCTKGAGAEGARPLCAAAEGRLHFLDWAKYKIRRGS